MSESQHSPMVAAAAAARRAADDAYRAAVRAAVAAGETFAAVAEAAGVSRQSVHEMAGPRPRQGPRRPPAAEKSAPKTRRSRRVAEPEPERTQGTDVRGHRAGAVGAARDLRAARVRLERPLEEWPRDRGCVTPTRSAEVAPRRGLLGFVVLVIDTEDRRATAAGGGRAVSTPEDALLEAGGWTPTRTAAPAGGRRRRLAARRPGVYPPDDPRPRDVAR
jgi:hypothetical protein